MTAAPLTFLFTDIEGSTRRWESGREAMSAALARHDALVRAAIEERGGRVFKTVGDAFCAVFDSAPDALDAAHQAQRALATEPWAAVGAPADRLRVRMAVHTGLAEARDGDYFGPTLNRVARLLAAGHGGQVLVSRVAEELAHRHLPPGLRLRDLGEHRLKDLDRAERVFQLDPDPAPDGWPIAFPPLRTLDAVPGNLPVQLSSFVGRAREIEAVGQLVRDRRLVTVTGVGGTGKTRLALEVAAELAEGFPDGAWFVDLAPLAQGDAEAVASAVVQAVGAPAAPARPSLDVAADHLRARRALVVLDNCEHLVAACAAVAGALVRAAPGIRVLATSREPLGIAGETVAPLDPLEAPPLLDRSPGTVELARFTQLDAVQLFLDRATAVQPAFAVGAANAPAVAEICHRLDGIPLAIELAAARVRSMEPADIARRLDARFRLLTGGARDHLPRQQTLQAAIAWSYDLLTDAERYVVERFGVFACAMPLAAAEAVCAGNGVEVEDVLDLLDALVAKSLVARHAVCGETWYRMLDTVRAFARERLGDGGEAEQAHRRRLSWYLDVARGAGIERLGAASDALGVRLDPVRSDVRAALQRAARSGRHAPLAFGVLDALWWLILHGEHRAWLAIVESLSDASTEQRDVPLRLAYVRAWLHLVSGDPRRARELAGAALSGIDAEGDLRSASWLWSVLALALAQLGDGALAQEAIARSLEVRRSLGDEVEVAIGLNMAGEIARGQGDLVAATGHYHQALALPLGSDDGSTPHLWARHNLAQVLLGRGDVRDAAAHLEAILAHDAATLQGIGASSLCALGGCAAASGDGLLAATLLGCGMASLSRDGILLEPLDEADRQRHEAAARALLSAADWDVAFAEGRSLSRDETLALARAAAARLASEGTMSVDRTEEVPRCP